MRERRRDIFHPLTDSSNSCNSWDWTKMKLGGQDSPEPPHGWRGLHPWATWGTPPLGLPCIGLPGAIARSWVWSGAARPHTRDSWCLSWLSLASGWNLLPPSLHIAGWWPTWWFQSFVRAKGQLLIVNLFSPFLTVRVEVMPSKPLIQPGYFIYLFYLFERLPSYCSLSPKPATPGAVPRAWISTQVSPAPTRAAGKQFPEVGAGGGSGTRYSALGCAQLEP